jgi:hypothetical protein
VPYPCIAGIARSTSPADLGGTYTMHRCLPFQVECCLRSGLSDRSSDRRRNDRDHGTESDITRYLSEYKVVSCVFYGESYMDDAGYQTARVCCAAHHGAWWWCFAAAAVRLTDRPRLSELLHTLQWCAPRPSRGTSTTPRAIACSDAQTSNHLYSFRVGRWSSWSTSQAQS